jgi:hypothetical protein
MCLFRSGNSAVGESVPQTNERTEMRLHKKCAVVVAAVATCGLVGASSASAAVLDCSKVSDA